MATKSARKTEGDILDFHVQVTPAKPRKAANVTAKAGSPDDVRALTMAHWTAANDNAAREAA